VLCLACVLPGLPCHQGRAQVEGKGAGRRGGGVIVLCVQKVKSLEVAKVFKE